MRALLPCCCLESWTVGGVRLGNRDSAIVFFLLPSILLECQLAQSAVVCHVSRSFSRSFGFFSSLAAHCEAMQVATTTMTSSAGDETTSAMPCLVICPCRVAAGYSKVLFVVTSHERTLIQAGNAANTNVGCLIIQDSRCSLRRRELRVLDE